MQTSMIPLSPGPGSGSTETGKGQCHDVITQVNKQGNNVETNGQGVVVISISRLLCSGEPSSDVDFGLDLCLFFLDCFCNFINLTL